MNNSHLYPHANQYLEFILSLIEQGFTWRQVESAKIMYDSNVDEFIAYIWNGEKVVYADLRPDKKKKVVSDFVTKITEHFMGIIRTEYNVDPSKFPLVKERYAEITLIEYYGGNEGSVLTIDLTTDDNWREDRHEYIISPDQDKPILYFRNHKRLEDIE